MSTVYHRGTSKHGQNHNLNEYGVTDTPEGKVKYHLSIHHDTSYDFQSHASVDYWDGCAWTRVASLLAAEVKGHAPVRELLLRLLTEVFSPVE